ncbi:MAG: 50S ribosomal protein L11 methyltransferase [Myxococcota bacterium]
MVRWQLGLEGVEVAWDALAGLLEARGATVGCEAGPNGPRRIATFETLDRMNMDAVGAWLEGFQLDDVGLVTRMGDTGPWQDGWRAIFQAAQVSPRLWVRPAWEAPVKGRLDIVIDPTHAFGAGFHPTTAGSLQLTDRVLGRLAQRGVAEASVLDVGTGTGILAIAAAHLGARVVGIEVQAAACTDAAANAALNGVANRVVVEHGNFRSTSEGDARVFDVVLANVLAGFLMRHAPAILAAARHAIVLAGVDEDTESDVLTVYGVGTGATTLTDRFEDRGWVTLALARSALAASDAFRS